MYWLGIVTGSRTVCRNLSVRGGFATVAKATKVARAGCTVDPVTKALTPSIVMSSTFEREKDLSYDGEFIYGRMGNPTRSLLEKTLAELEGGDEACSFGSGLAGIHALISALGQGGHVVLGEDMYHGTRSLIHGVFSRWGLEHSVVDLSSEEELSACLERASRPGTGPVVLISEIPSNPMLNVPDMRRLSDLCRAHGALHAVDSTWMSPVLCSPFEFGADMVLHSTTKYMGGHSDMTGGAVILGPDCNETAGSIFEQCKTVQQLGGAVPSPFDCWLLLRGLRSLQARMKLHCENANYVAQFLSEHPAVSKVHFPGNPDHPQHEIMKSQMNIPDCYGGMMSIEIHGGMEKAVAVAAKTKLFARATSLGGTESLIEHRASIEPEDTPTPDSLLRLSIGLEDKRDLVDDLSNALGKR
jgi:cystathionine gamma-synthase